MDLWSTIRGNPSRYSISGVALFQWDLDGSIFLALAIQEATIVHWNIKHASWRQMPSPMIFQVVCPKPRLGESVLCRKTLPTSSTCFGVLFHCHVSGTNLNFCEVVFGFDWKSRRLETIGLSSWSHQNHHFTVQILNFQPNTNKIWCCLANHSIFHSVLAF